MEITKVEFAEESDEKMPSNIVGELYARKRLKLN
jgi:hypothetical protein